MTDFAMTILTRLVGRRVWEMESIWTGFKKCCIDRQPQSHAVLVKLPRPQIEELLTETPGAREPLREFVRTHPAGVRADACEAITMLYPDEKKRKEEEERELARKQALLVYPIFLYMFFFTLLATGV